MLFGRNLRHPQEAMAVQAIGRHGQGKISACRASNQACTKLNRTYGFWTGGAVCRVLERQGGSSACAWLADACVIPLDIR